MIGTSASGQDISRDIARVAKEVHIAARSVTNGIPTKLFGYDNMWLHSMVNCYLIANKFIEKYLWTGLCQ